MFARFVCLLSFVLALNASAQDRLPEINFTDLDQNSVALSDTTGKLRVINFWATWCPPCVKEMPSLSRLDNEIETINGEVIAINVGEDQTSVDAFLMENLDSTNMQIWLDQPGKSFKAFELKGLPITLIVDSEDRIIDRVLGEREWDSAETVERLRQLVSGS